MGEPENAQYPKTAACACGALTVRVSAPPKFVHACTCHDCQRRTGSAFSYSAFFPGDAVSMEGERRSWRRQAESGNTVETVFCPSCGCQALLRLSGLPDIVGVPVGTFADGGFEKPGTFYWTVRRHEWLEAFASVAAVERQ